MPTRSQLLADRHSRYVNVATAARPAAAPRERDRSIQRRRAIGVAGRFRQASARRLQSANRATGCLEDWYGETGDADAPQFFA